ncbi:MAG: aminopeptidase P family protein [Planctomycetes bacterium]|nr:aminopeptidase P family protein [Planctomycetota bacterium]
MWTNPARLKQLRAHMREKGLDAFVVTDETNVRYLSGFTGDSSALLITDDRRYIVTDGRYMEECERECPDWKVVERQEFTFEKIGETAKKHGVKTVGIEAHHVTVGQMREVRRAFKKTRIRATRGVVHRMRMIKDEREIELIRAANRVGERGLYQLLSDLRPGRTEAVLAARLELYFRTLGATRESFPCILAARQTSSIPHYHPTLRKIRTGDPVLVDSGAVVNSYCSDLTRVFFTNGAVPPKWEVMYGAVLEANRVATEAVRPGVKAIDVDKAAREYLKAVGFDKEFAHSTGHGLGMNVHEPPRISKWDRTVLKPGMVITIEPGVYVPGFGGVRIEDMVMVTETGRETITTFPKDLDSMILRGKPKWRLVHK